MRSGLRTGNGVAMTRPCVLFDRPWMTTDKAGIERGTGTEANAEDESENA